MNGPREFVLILCSVKELLLFVFDGAMPNEERTNAGCVEAVVREGRGGSGLQDLPKVEKSRKFWSLLPCCSHCVVVGWLPLLILLCGKCGCGFLVTALCFLSHLAKLLNLEATMKTKQRDISGGTFPCLGLDIHHSRRNLLIHLPNLRWMETDHSLCFEQVRSDRLQSRS